MVAIYVIVAEEHQKNLVTDNYDTDKNNSED